MNTPALRLQPWPALSPAQQAQVRGLAISAAQLEYAGPGDRQLAAVEASVSAELVGLGILAAGQAVGFLVLKRGAEAPDWVPPGAAVISGMRIDQSHQGAGLGSAALALLPAWVRSHWPGTSELVLAVDEENLRGLRAYARAGFRDWGRRELGRIGWVRYMSRPVDDDAGVRDQPAG